MLALVIAVHGIVCPCIEVHGETGYLPSAQRVGHIARQGDCHIGQVGEAEGERVGAPDAGYVAVDVESGP